MQILVNHSLNLSWGVSVWFDYLNVCHVQQGRQWKLSTSYFQYSCLLTFVTFFSPTFPIVSVSRLFSNFSRLFSILSCFSQILQDFSNFSYISSIICHKSTDFVLFLLFSLTFHLISTYFHVFSTFYFIYFKPIYLILQLITRALYCNTCITACLSSVSSLLSIFSTLLYKCSLDGLTSYETRI